MNRTGEPIPRYGESLPSESNGEQTFVIGRRLNVPVVSKTPEEAASHFEWFAHFAALDCPASSQRTCEQLGWQSKQPGPIPDLDHARYFEA